MRVTNHLLSVEVRDTLKGIETSQKHILLTIIRLWLMSLRIMSKIGQSKIKDTRRIENLTARRREKNLKISRLLKKPKFFSGTASQTELVFDVYLGLILGAHIIKALKLDLRPGPDDRNPFYSRQFKEFWLDIESSAPDPFYIIELVKRLCGPQSTCLECPGRPLCFPLPNTKYYRR